MTTTDPRKGLQVATVAILEQLTDDEAIAFNMFLLTGGRDPKSNMAWPKIEPLFTQRAADEGVSIHPDVRVIAESYLRNRIDSIGESRQP